MQKILISACLLGERVRYDGGNSRVDGELLARWQREGRVVALCPEVAGGLPVPRPAAEIGGGSGVDVLEGRARVQTKARDVTDAFLSGANQALLLARANGIKVAVLKARSPSCGNAQIYDGTFSRTLRHGPGVTAALLAREGIAVFSDEQLAEASAFLDALERAQ